MKDKITEVFDSIHVSTELQASTAKKMLEKHESKKPWFKYAVSFALVLLVVTGSVLIPQKKNVPDNISFAVYASDGTNRKEIPLSKDAVQISLYNNEKYKSGGSEGGGDDKVMNWKEEFDFNLRCSGRPDIQRVTYTAYNCEFMKKTFLTKEQVEGGEASEYTDGTTWGETNVDGTQINWGFAPIGYVYSADFLEQVNTTNFGLKITYIEEKAKEFEPFTKEEGVKVNKLRTAAFAKAYITAEIQLKNGETINKTIQIGQRGMNGSVIAWVAE